MSTRARWAIVLSIVAIAEVVAVLVLLNRPQRWVAVAPSTKTWIVQPGETLKLSTNHVHPNDLYRCQGKGGVNGTPPRGHGVGGSGGFSVETSLDGTVTAYCEPGPPGNV